MNRCQFLNIGGKSGIHDNIEVFDNHCFFGVHFPQFHRDMSVLSNFRSQYCTLNPKRLRKKTPEHYFYQRHSIGIKFRINCSMFSSVFLQFSRHQFDLATVPLKTDPHTSVGQIMSVPNQGILVVLFSTGSNCIREKT